MSSSARADGNVTSLIMITDIRVRLIIASFYIRIALCQGMASTGLGLVSRHFDVLVQAVSAHQARKTQVAEFANFSRIALLAYDIVLNLGREKQFIWDDKFRPSHILYYLVRYPVIAFQIFQVTYKPTMPQVQTTQLSCTQASNPLSFVLTFISLIVFDVLATGLITWGILRIIYDQGGFMKLSSHRLAKLIVQSGALYYVTITALQTGAVILYFLPQGVYSTVLNNYLTPLSTILVAHFLLDLRQMVRGSSAVGSTMSEMESISFAAPPPSYTRASHAQRKLGHGLSIVRDFEHVDTKWDDERDDDDSWHGGKGQSQLASHAWPLEDLVDRAQAVEARLAVGHAV
ncbi:hypothetical protein HGRIS_005243 [Hohenbuehelia grisea]|uniref:DUF6533 domain-containing protein n=1 Tax=Hohenbuehelia grisea TaxID=104357 RepID=A0ABR3JEX9_9AGAR